MTRCCSNGCFDECRWIRVKDGKIIGYYCDKHMTYLAMNEDGINNGLYRGSRLFKI